MAKLGKALGAAYVRIRGDSSKLKGDLNTAKGQVEASLKHMAKSVALFSAAFTAVLIPSMKKAIDAASSLEEVTSKFNTVFGRQQKVAEEWSKTLVNGYAMSTRESKQYLSSMQDLLVPMGMQADAAGKLSFEIVKLSADLASFNNMPTAQVMGDIQSALVGNYETMKKYGAILNVAAIEQEALKSGLARTKGELTATNKVQAAYNLIIKSSTFAIGDQQRTMDSYANQIKQFHANVEELFSMLGKQLLPAATDIVKEINNWIKANETLINQKMKEYVDSVAGAMRDVKALYDALPADFVGAVGYGVVGRFLFGAPGALLGVGYKIGQLMDKVLSGYDVSDNVVELEKNIERLQSKIAFYSKDNPEGMAPFITQWKQELKLAEDSLAIMKKAREQNFITITPGQRSTGISTATTTSLPRPSLPTTLGITGAEQGHIASAQMAAQSAEFVKQAKAEYEGLMIGATDSFMGMAEANKRANDIMEEQTKTTTFNMSQLTERTAWSMQENFSSVFYDAVTGELKSFEDYARAIFLSISQAWADMMAQMLTQSIFGNELKGGGGLDSLVGFAKGLLGLGGGSFKATGASGAFNIGQFGTTAFGMAGGGYLGEDVVGIGRKTGSSYELHADEYVVPPDKLRGGGDGQNTNVNINITAFDSKDVHRVLSENKGLIGNLVGGQMMRNQSLRTNVKMASR